MHRVARRGNQASRLNVLWGSAVLSLVIPRAVAGDVVWDNGLSYRTGLSHLTEPSFRSIFDDFTVDSAGWSLTALELLFYWLGNDYGFSEDLELTFYADIDGRPDLDRVVSVPTGTSFTEELCVLCPKFVGLTTVRMRTEFDAIVLDEGTYWAEMHVVSQRNGFQWIGDYPQSRGAPIWVNYEDFGGFQPGFDVFGDDYDVNFVLEGAPIPAPSAALLMALLLGYRCRAKCLSP